MSPRRVIRATQTPIESSTSHHKSEKFSPSLFCRLIVIVWKGVQIFWYWFERFFLIGILISLTVGLAWWLSQKPSLLRDWAPSENILPEVSFSGDIISIKNIRDHIWTNIDSFTPRYSTESYNLQDIERAYYIIVPFSDRDGPAHTMLSFTFSGGENIVISPEIRKERGESFDALRGVMNQYELMYVIAREEDVLKLRTNYRKNQVYMYPIKTDKEKIQGLFRSMIIRAEKLQKEPEFYNTLWNNCATSILYHANALRIEKLDAGKYTLFPAHSDTLVYEAGLIDTRLSLPEARTYYRIDEVARSAGTGTIFSDIIRKEIR